MNASFAQDCKYGQVNLQGNEVCRVSLDSFGKCAPDYGYGFGIGKPCIFIKLNRVYVIQLLFLEITTLTCDNLNGSIFIFSCSDLWLGTRILQRQQ